MVPKNPRRDCVFYGVIFQIFGICILDAQIAAQNRFLPKIFLRADDSPVAGDFAGNFAFELPIRLSRAIFFCYNRARR